MSTTTSSRDLRVTIDLIAAEANVGRTTVADIVNRGAGHRYKSSTRDKVLRTAKRLGYVPSSIAQTIARGRSGQVGLMFTRDFRNPYWARIAGEVESLLRKRGLFLQLAITDGDHVREAELVRHLHGQHIEGLIVGPVYADEQVQQHQHVFQNSIPIVAFGGSIHDFDVVGVNHATGRRLAVEHLLNLGHRRIGYLCLPDKGGPEGDDVNITALRETLIQAGIFDPRWIFSQWAELPLEQHVELMQQFLALWQQTPADLRPTADLGQRMTVRDHLPRNPVKTPADALDQPLVAGATQILAGDALLGQVARPQQPLPPRRGHELIHLCLGHIGYVTYRR